MDKSLEHMDWSLVQSFLAVAETGSLSAAAAALGQSQPTLGRHIKSLEAALGSALFRRRPRGLELTSFGAEIQPAAQAMRMAAQHITNAAELESGELGGTVRIACSVFAAHHILPKVLAEIRTQAPGIALVLQASDDTDNLTFREADIALRMYRPNQDGLIAKKIADIEMSVFAAHSYIQRKGRPETLETLFEHDVVGYDQSPLMIDAVAEFGYQITPDAFCVRTDNQSAYWELVRAGCGIGFSQAHLGRGDPVVEELALDIPIPALPVWLTTHEDVRRIPRVDHIWNMLAEMVPQALA